MAERIEKRLAALRASPDNVRFAEAERLAEHFFGAARSSGSHRVFKTPWRGDPRVNLQEGSGGRAKAYQVRQLLRAIDRLLAETGAKRDDND